MLAQRERWLPVDPVNAAFGRGRRLINGTDYSYVFANARRSADKFFTVLARPGRTEKPRLGLTVARRVAKRAVDRNLLKRLARESFRQLDLEPLDFVVLARAASARADRVELRRSLDRHFLRLAGRSATHRVGNSDG